MRLKPVYQQNKRKKSTIIALSFGILLIAILVGIAVYLSDYYPADESVQASLSDSNTVKVTKENNWIVFMPVERTTESGLIFYPGGKVDELAYVPILRSLADQGIPSVLVSMPFRLAVLRSGAAASVIDAFPSINQWYIGGHSLGGAMAASYAANNPEDIEGVILLAAYPPSDLSQYELKLLSIYGNQDLVLNMDRYMENRSYFPADFLEVIIDGGNHANFGDYGEQSGDGQALISAQEQQRITIEAIQSFINP